MKKFIRAGIYMVAIVFLISLAINKVSDLAQAAEEAKGAGIIKGGLKTADTAISTSGTVVYTVAAVRTSGTSQPAASTLVLANGTVSDSETAAQKYLTITDCYSTDTATQFYSFPKGLYFPNGVYANTTNMSYYITAEEPRFVPVY